MTDLDRSSRARAGVVIVGGGLAGQRACETLRRHAYEGPIRVLAAEPDRPYDRPPLSKEYLVGNADETALRFGPAGWYAEHDIELLLDRRALRLDPIAREVTTSDGTQLTYHTLLIATGSTPRRLPIAGGFDTSTSCAPSTTRAPCATRSVRARAWSSSALASSARRWRPPRAASARTSR